MNFLQTFIILMAHHLIPFFFRQRRYLKSQLGEDGRRDDISLAALDQTERAVEYVRPLFLGLRNEVLYLILLDDKCRPLRDMRIAEGVPNRVQVDTHKLLRDVARTDATCGILAHNHPTGLAVPSEADMIATMGIMQALGPLGVSIIDHIIVAGEDACSMRDRGCLPMYRAGRDTLNAASRY